MKSGGQKEALYRKVNTRARGVHHDAGGDFRHERNTKAQTRSDTLRGAMHGKKNRGLDYTPLFRFLLSKVGQAWPAVYSEARSRLDREDPIFWLVARREEDGRALVCTGESSYYSGLFIDENQVLRKVDPALGPEDVPVTCSCCTYTLNGLPVPRQQAGTGEGERPAEASAAPPRRA